MRMTKVKLLAGVARGSEAVLAHRRLVVDQARAQEAEMNSVREMSIVKFLHHKVTVVSTYDGGDGQMREVRHEVW